MTPEETLTDLLAIPTLQESMPVLLTVSAILGVFLSMVTGGLGWFVTDRVKAGAIVALCTILGTTAIMPFVAYRQQRENKDKAQTQMLAVLREEAKISDVQIDGLSYKVTVNPIEGKIFGQPIKGPSETFRIRKTTAEKIEQEVFKPQGIALLDR